MLEIEIVLQNKATAFLYPDTLNTTEEPPRKFLAIHAIDGDYNIGSSGGGYEGLNCASTSYTKQYRHLQYLRINVQTVGFIAAVKLHLRDGHRRQVWQHRLTVSLGNDTDPDSTIQCGTKAYNADRDGQSPIFICLKSAQFIWVFLRRSRYPVQVCEVQAFKGHICSHFSQ